MDEKKPTLTVIHDSGETRSEGLKNAFLNHIGNNMARIKSGCMANCRKQSIPFDDDVFSDTILKCAERILEKGMDDHSNQGMEDYFFKAFKMNSIREPQYARISKRTEMAQEDLEDAYERWYNEAMHSADDKIASDFYKDFSVLYILTKVEENFPKDVASLFRLKYLIPKMTYRRLSQKTAQRNIREKVVEVRKWLQGNITKEEISKAFWNVYGNSIL